MIEAPVFLIDAKQLDLGVGDEATFKPNYVTSISSMTSFYVSKSCIIGAMDQQS